MEGDYISVRFENNASKRWDGKEVEVPRKTVVRLGEWTGEGLERAQVHWPGKGGKSKGKIWNCVVLTPDLEADAAEDETEETATAGSSASAATSTRPRRASRGKWKLERELIELEHQRTARELSAAAESASTAEPPPTLSSTSTNLLPPPTSSSSTATQSGKRSSSSAATQSGKRSKTRGRGTGVYTYTIIVYICAIQRVCGREKKRSTCT